MAIDESYDPGSPGKKGTIFGLPFSVDDARCVIIPVPWDVTVSYGAGTSQGPDAVLDASPQLDLEIPGLQDPWRLGLALADAPKWMQVQNNDLRKRAADYIKALEHQDMSDALADHAEIVSDVNHGTERLRQSIFSQAKRFLAQNKLVGLLGGDHSTPLGLIQALGETHGSFGILQIDAHMDLRRAYEGFEHSHASIMYNVLESTSISSLVQVGIRDYCLEEKELAENSDKVSVFYDVVLKERQMNGVLWATIVAEMIERLPHKVYVSFDIDGLDPALCPGTGTPVPGGLSYDEAIYLIKMVVKSGRQIIGFDLCEVAPHSGDREWNANVGARILYQLTCWAGVSNEFIDASPT